MAEEELEDIAGEYVLGTLSLQEREEAAARLNSDPAFAALVAKWEDYLSPLNEATSLSPLDQAPPEELWHKIHDRLSREPQIDQALGAPTLLSTDSKQTERQVAEIVALATVKQSRNRWRAAAIGAMAMAAAFVGLQAGGIYLPYLPTPQAEGRYVAVLNPQGSSPGFLIRVDLGTKQLAVQRLADAAPEGKDYELWLIEPNEKPKSLHVVGRDQVQQIAFRPANAEQPVQFAVTLEPEGGSPSGVATGPIVFSGQLLTAK